MLNREYFVNTLNGFDEDFYIYQEDADLRERIKIDTKPIKFIKEAFVVHPWRLQKNPEKMARLQVISYQLFCSKHPDLIPKVSFVNYIKKEFIFYVKNVLFKLIPYKGRGVLKFIKAHIIANKFKNQITENDFDTHEKWTSFN